MIRPDSLDLDAGDLVVVATSPETLSAGFAGRVGTCFGWTKLPAEDLAQVEEGSLLVGQLGDVGVGVLFEDRDEPEEAWFDSGIVARVEPSA